MNQRMISAPQIEWIAARSAALLLGLKQDASVLGLDVSRLEAGATLIDCGVSVPGSIEAGRRITEMSHGGMASVRIGIAQFAEISLPELVLDSWLPALSAYGLQVSVPLSEIDPAIRISGPILARFDDSRLQANREELNDQAWGIAVVESDRLPHADVVEALAQRSGLPVSQLTCLVVPTGSVAGVTQIAGRINESVIFTMEESLGMDCACVSQLFGSVPIALAATFDESRIVTQDDFIHYLGRVVLTVDATPDIDLANLAEQLTFRSTSIYGTLFSELLAAAKGVFEAIPGLVDLNKVAQVTVIDQRSGAATSAGEPCPSILFGSSDGPETLLKEES